MIYSKLEQTEEADQGFTLEGHLGNIWFLFDLPSAPISVTPPLHHSSLGDTDKAENGLHWRMFSLIS